MEIETAIRARELLNKMDELQDIRKNYIDASTKFADKFKVNLNDEYLSLKNFTLTICDEYFKKLEHELSILS